MSDEKVISLKSRKPLAEEKAAEAETAKIIEDGRREAQLEMLDKFRAHIAAGRLDGVIIVARSPETGLFAHDLIFPPTVHTSGEAFAWAGIVGSIHLEMQDVAQMAPILNADLEKLAPFIDEEGILDD